MWIVCEIDVEGKFYGNDRLNSNAGNMWRIPISAEYILPAELLSVLEKQSIKKCEQIAWLKKKSKKRV